MFQPKDLKNQAGHKNSENSDLKNQAGHKNSVTGFVR